MMNNLIHKEKFYQLCEKSGVDYPDTFVHHASMGRIFDLPFAPPFIIKPSNGIEYWRNPFENQNKVYKVGTREELESVLTEIYKSGYKDSIIIQDFIPGDDTFMRVLTNYSDQNGKVKLMCLVMFCLKNIHHMGLEIMLSLLLNTTKKWRNSIKGF